MLMRPSLRSQARDFLLGINRAITAQLDLGEVLRRVLQASLVMLTGRAAFIALREPGSQHYTVRAHSGIDASALAQLNDKVQQLLQPQDGEFNRESLDSQLLAMAHAIDPALAQTIAMPLLFAQKPLGLLVVFRSYHSSIGAGDWTILQSFAAQAAIAVNNAQLYGAIDTERQRLESILNSSGDGVFILSPELGIQRANSAFARMLGWDLEDLEGAPKGDVIRWARLETKDLEGLLRAKGQAAAPAQPWRVAGELLRRDGSVLSISITYAPVWNKQGKLESVIANARDITSLRKAQEMQSVFISTVHHELRTPIAIIKGYASTFAREDVEWEPALMREKMAIIEDEADRLTALVEDLLTASKLQSGPELWLTLRPTNLSELARMAAERLQSQSAQDIELSFPADFPLIEGDEARLRQVIDNLLTNAMKYSPPGSAITIGGRFSEAQVTLFVRDSGAGIPKAEQEKIFERFYRIDDSLTRSEKGTGLGLYLARAIVEAHGGQLSLRSQLGSGSTFFFTLPRS